VEVNADLRMSSAVFDAASGLHGKGVLLKTLACGVCHSDLHLREGGYDLGDGKRLKVTDRGVTLPVTPGHEVTGTVVAKGVDSTLSLGEDVLLYPWQGCSSCSVCASGNTHLCDSPRSIGIFQDGGYADHVVVQNGDFVIPLDGVSAEKATSIACGGLTAFTAVKKSLANDPKSVLVIGCGGLGLLGVQLLKYLAPHVHIVAVDTNTANAAAAVTAGASISINSAETEDAHGSIMAQTEGGKGFDSVIDFVSAPATGELALGVLKKRGNLVLVGLFGGELKLPLVSIPLKSLTIQGAYTGSFADMQELLDLTREGVIDPLITKTYPLNQANRALEDLANHKILGRGIISFPHISSR
jgi:propanol-preferring alcohol dehydrogenase